MRSGSLRPSSSKAPDAKVRQEVEDKALPKPTQGSRGATSGTRAMAAESRHTGSLANLANLAIAELDL